MKILQVISTWKGGAIRVVFDVAGVLSHKGHMVTIYATDLRKENKDLDERAIDNVHSLHTLCRGFAKKTKFYFTPKVILLAKNVKYFDILHLHEYRTFQNIVVHYYARKYDVPYVLQAHGSLPRMMAKRRLKWLYDVFFGYRLLRDASKVIALSGVEAEQYRDMGVPEEKIEVIPNGINLSEYGDLPPEGSFKKKFNIDDDEKIVLYLGRIHKSKGLVLLVKAVSLVAKELDKVRLAIVGPDDGYFSPLAKIVSSLKMEEKVLFTGFVEEKEKLAALLDSDVFVTPSFSGFPITFLEAGITGTPIITTTKADELGWIHNKVGLVVEHSPMKLAEAITFFLMNTNVADKMGDKAKQFISSEFSIENMTGKLEKLYENVARR